MHSYSHSYYRGHPYPENILQLTLKPNGDICIHHLELTSWLHIKFLTYILSTSLKFGYCRAFTTIYDEPSRSWDNMSDISTNGLSLVNEPVTYHNDVGLLKNLANGLVAPRFVMIAIRGPIKDTSTKLCEEPNKCLSRFGFLKGTSKKKWTRGGGLYR